MPWAKNSFAEMDDKNLLEKSLSSGQSLCFFPEGTSTDGMDVKPFKSSLFSESVYKKLILFSKAFEDYPEKDIVRI